MTDDTHRISPNRWLGSKQKKFLWRMIAALAVLRIAMMFHLPYTDTTEARYVEIARKMVETGDWVTPQFAYGVPFWGKPPLHTWVSAAGMKIFGVNHFGGRIFIFLTAVAMVVMLYRWARGIKGPDYALVGTTILASGGLFYLAMATVMTDMVMVAGTSLSMAGFYSAIRRAPGAKLWGFLFFVGLAIGMLAKGPIAVVLTALPIFMWVLFQNRWVDTWQRLPWITGGLLACVIFVPWYVMAELKTPGFLRYFIVGEHFERFINSGWKGDLYGSGHAQPKGMIWIFWVLAMLPWSFFFLAPLLSFKAIFSGMKGEDDGWSSYLLCWALSPMIFFTMATNIIPTYIFTGVPAVCFLSVDLWKFAAKEREFPTPGVSRFFTGTACVALMIFAAAYVLFIQRGPDAPKKSQMYVIEETNRLRDKDSGTVNYWKKRYYSAEFYTEGKSKIIEDERGLMDLTENTKRDFLIIRKGGAPGMQPGIMDHFDYVGPFGKDELYYEKSLGANPITTHSNEP